jgi:tetratricopeptide (TPR) repeat protein
MLRKLAGWKIWLVVGLGLVLVLSLLAYQTPFVQERVAWRVSEFRARIKYAINPPEEAVFTPNPTIAAMVESTLAAFTATPTPSPQPGPTAAPTETPTPTTEPTAIPGQVLLTGVRHEYEKWNNCGPATLSMTLSYWGWEGDQGPIAAFVKPNPRDKNVMPYELEAFIESETELQMIVRYGGTLELAKQFLAAGYPFMIEKGYDFPGKGWMGHYQLLVGYDDDQSRFAAYDSYTGGPNLKVTYEALEQNWRAFNYTFLILYPKAQEEEVMSLLGEYADEQVSVQIAAQRASDEVFTYTGRDQFFAWFNRGTSLRQLQDYAGAAAAYDEAFKIDAQLAINDPDRRPWRMLWYQTGPYWAYYYTGRYYDVLNLANLTIENMSEPAVEESFYWRALAREALGDLDGAIADYQRALKWHPAWEPALAQLSRLGVPE